MKFSERLKQLRINNKLTQEELAQKIGLSRHAVTGYENGKREPSIKTILALSELFECSTDYLLGVSNYLIIKPQGEDFLAVIDRAKKDKVTSDDINDIIDLVKKLRKEDF